MKLFQAIWQHTVFEGVPNAYCYGRNNNYHARGKVVLASHWECPVCGLLEPLTNEEKAYFDARDEAMLNGWSDPSPSKGEAVIPDPFSSESQAPERGLQVTAIAEVA